MCDFSNLTEKLFWTRVITIDNLSAQSNHLGVSKDYHHVVPGPSMANSFPTRHVYKFPLEALSVKCQGLTPRSLLTLRICWFFCRWPLIFNFLAA